ncbi:MAG: hypothetical protein EB127_26570, partial [Alphaproteobacteria bacterium]|nr:hypothetical protein [Alphaproteobacteria bacterium]
MVAGSDAYLNAWNSIVDTIPQEYPHVLNNTSISYNIDKNVVNAPYFVRSAGTYLILVAINTNQASQFALYVNGEPRPLTRSGNNGGSGQLVLESTLLLNDNDCIVIRNDESTTQAVVSQLYIGGTLPGNNSTFTIVKVSPYCPAEKDCDWDERFLSKKKRHLFKKLQNKLECDPELMVRGFNTHGSFYTVSTLTVPVETSVPWDMYQNVNGLTWNPSGSDPTQIQVLSGGVYKILFVANVSTPAQYAIAINGVPLNYTIQGTNKGAMQFSLRAVVSLKDNDIVTFMNHTSANGDTIIQSGAGGTQPTISSIATIIKIAQNCKPCMDEVKPCKREWFSKFREYLLHQKCLQISGCNALVTASSDTFQTLVIGDNLEWSNTHIQREFHHRQGDDKFRVTESGVYDLIVDSIFNEPSQLTLFVN